MLNSLKKEVGMTRTENGAAAYLSTGSECLDLFAAAGALRSAAEADVIRRFIRAYAEDATLAVKILFFARDIRGGLGERRVFRVIFRWMADHEPESVRRNIPWVADYGRFDDLLVLLGTACEPDMETYIKEQLKNDLKALESSGQVSLLGKWLPSVNASSPDTVKAAKKLARILEMSDAEYRKTLTALRARIRMIENNLREKDYTFDYEKQPSKALYKYRKAFLRNDRERYVQFLEKASETSGAMHTGTLTPYDVISPLISAYVGPAFWEEERPEPVFSEEERRAMDVTWNALEDFTDDGTGKSRNRNALAVVDGSGSMYWGGKLLPAAVAQSLGIYFAEHCRGAFHNHFITFGARPQLVEVKGRDIVEKVRYCMQFDDCSNTDLMKVFELLIRTAVRYRIPGEEMPARLYIISDMEFDCCQNASVANFQAARELFRKHGYHLPQVVFWNVQSRNIQQPVRENEQGAVLVSGCSPQIFGLLKNDRLDSRHFMLQVLLSERYEKITA